MKSITEFEALIHRCETLAARNPISYRWRVAALAILGFAFVIAIFTGSLTLGLGVLALVLITKHALFLKLAILPLWFAYSMLKSLWLKMPAPEGQALTAKDAPQLFAEIESVRKALNAHRAHKVLLLRNSFNAAIVQVPRLGIIGWHKNYLLLGLPLMEALPPEQFRAVLGHEFGHLSRAQSRFRNWVYRARQIWPRLLGALQQGGGSSIVKPFFNWYAPYFNAYSFVLARTNEYDADQAAARVTSPQIAGAALSNVATRAAHVGNDFWANLMRRAASDPTPPARPFDEFLGAARFLPERDANQSLLQALQQKTTLDDTHPSLAERLAALGASPGAVTPTAQSAAEVLLGPLRDTLIHDINATWSQEIAANWQERHERAAAQKLKLAELQSPSAAPTAKELLDGAIAATGIEGPAAALPFLDKAIGSDPSFGLAHVVRGRLRVQLGDEGGLDDVHNALKVSSDTETVALAHQFLANYHYARRDIAKCQPHADALREIEERKLQERAQRTTLRSMDRFEPADGENEQQLRQGLALAAKTEPSVKKIWLAKKIIPARPDVPQYVMVVGFKWRTKGQAQILQRIANQQIGANLTVYDHGEVKGLARPVCKCRGALVYPVKA